MIPAMTAARPELAELVGRLATRAAGRSEATVQADVRMLLLTAPLNLTEHGVESIQLETPAGERRRIDVEAGFTVIEVKRDLRVGNVREDAIQQLAGYVAQRSATLGQRYVGVLTDGAEWRLYHLTLSGALTQVGDTLTVTAAEPDVDALLVWLEGVLATGQAILPTPVEIERRLGAESPSHLLDYADLRALFDAHRDHPSVALKRQLWAKLLTTALGSSFRDDDALFVNHTLLVISAEVIAHAVVGYAPVQLAPGTLVSGALFDQAQIAGVVEEDFFDWVLEVDGGEDFVRTLARRLARFEWSAVEHDVMKVLYESVIGRQERYSLGEYYTPDWLAERVVQEVVADPLHTRVLDPGCGSGTFLFHAVRRYLAAATDAGVPNGEAVRGATEHVIGVDVHPVAVTLARVTYLLAIGLDRIADSDRGAVNVPVYLGDSLQWGQEETLLNAGWLTVSTGTGEQLFASELRFPDSLIADAGRFDQLVAELADKATRRPRGGPIPSLRETLRRFPMTDAEQATVTDTFRVLCELHDQGRDHIWGYYLRNLARPTWLAEPANRVDALVGNPPWLTYNAIAPDLKAAFRAACEQRHLWGGGRAVRNHDLSALFVVRAIELYLKPRGRFGFVMPLATLSRRQFAGLRAADYPVPAEPVSVAFDTPWDLDAVRPHPFPVPSSVIFGERTSQAAKRPMPAQTVRWNGRLARRNADWSEAATRLVTAPGSIAIASGEHASPYAQRFESGAKLNPQVLVVVERAPAGPLGVPAGFSRVRSLRTRQENPPWRDVDTLEGTVEAEFVRPMHLGSTVVPFRALEPLAAIVPWDRAAKRLLDVDDDELDRYPRLAEWWRTASALWTEHGTPENYGLTGRVDFQRKLSRQLPPAQHRVVYTASGNRLAAARISDSPAVFQHKLYWAATRDIAEAHYLTAVLNSATLAQLVAPYQSRGQFGARDFDLYVWYVPIPEYDPTVALHTQLAEFGAHAETAAAGVDLTGTGFQTARRRVREALEDDGVADAIEDAVVALLAAPARTTEADSRPG
jgi:SAM-dependent methyltransferase